MSVSDVVWLKKNMRRVYNLASLGTWVCQCMGVMEYTYHTMWRCRECGRWQSSDF